MNISPAALVDFIVILPGSQTIDRAFVANGNFMYQLT